MTAKKTPKVSPVPKEVLKDLDIQWSLPSVKILHCHLSSLTEQDVDWLSDSYSTCFGISSGQKRSSIVHLQLATESRALLVRIDPNAKSCFENAAPLRSLLEDPRFKICGDELWKDCLFLHASCGIKTSFGRDLSTLKSSSLIDTFKAKYKEESKAVNWDEFRKYSRWEWNNPSENQVKYAALRSVLAFYCSKKPKNISIINMQEIPTWKLEMCHNILSTTANLQAAKDGVTKCDFNPKSFKHTGKDLSFQMTRYSTRVRRNLPLTVTDGNNKKVTMKPKSIHGKTAIMESRNLKNFQIKGITIDSSKDIGVEDERMVAMTREIIHGKMRDDCDILRLLFGGASKSSLQSAHQVSISCPRLNVSQKQAVAMILNSTNPISVIRGPPGEVDL